MAASCHLGYHRNGNGTIRSADRENFIITVITRFYGNTNNSYRPYDFFDTDFLNAIKKHHTSLQLKVKKLQKCELNKANFRERTESWVSESSIYMSMRLRINT